MLYLIVFLGAGIGGALRHGVNVGSGQLFGPGFPFGAAGPYGHPHTHNHTGQQEHRKCGSGCQPSAVSTYELPQPIRGRSWRGFNTLTFQVSLQVPY